MLQQQAVGTLNLRGGVVVSDPCYLKNDITAAELSRLGALVDVAQGRWRVDLEISDEGEWGHRVAALELSTRDGHSYGWEFLTNLGVDSGQMMVIDSRSLIDWRDEEFMITRDLDPETNAVHMNKLSYNGACFATLSGHGGVLGENRAYVSSTGFGDGYYPLYVAKDENGSVVGLRIEFISEDEEEEEEWEEEREEEEDA